MITSYITEDHRTWDNDLHLRALAYNIMTHDSNGFSPFYLCNGRYPRISPDLKRNEELRAAPAVQREVTENWEKKMHDLGSIRQVARDNQKEATERQAKYYDKHRSESTFKIGDKVLVKNIILPSAADYTCAGLAPKYLGVYTILREISQNIYETVSPQANGMPAT